MLQLQVKAFSFSSPKASSKTVNVSIQVCKFSVCNFKRFKDIFLICDYSSYVTCVDCSTQGLRQGECAGCANTLQEPKKSACCDCKKIKIIQKSLVVLRLTISMHFQQSEDLKFQHFLWKNAPGPPSPRIFGTFMAYH